MNLYADGNVMEKSNIKEWYLYTQPISCFTETTQKKICAKKIV